MLSAFGSAEVIDWMKGLGQESFIGSSGRVFPKIMKASPLLRALMHRLDERGVKLETRHRWQGWDRENQLVFETPDGVRSIEASTTLLTLGGPSWPRLGTNGDFLAFLKDKGIVTTPYRPANCGFDVNWRDDFIDRWAGEAVKSVALRFDNRTVQGDFVVTKNGIEGGSVYALSAPLRDHIDAIGEAVLTVDLRPHQSA